MRSPLRSRLRPALDEDETERPASGGSRLLRAVARGSLLLAVLGATGAYAVLPLVVGDTPTDATAAEDVGRQGPLPWEEVASRSYARMPDPHALSVTVDGTTTRLVTRAETVADILAARDVVLGPHDQVNVALDAAPEDVDEVVVTRVAFQDVSETKEIGFASREEGDGSLLSGRRVVVAEGKPGSETTLYRVRLVNGVETGREPIMRGVVPPVERVVRVGTRVPPPPPAPAPARAARVAPRLAAPAPGPAPRAAYSGADPRSIARTMVAARGWGGSQFGCLDRLWMKESNWNPYARNPSSGAYGIPQALPGSKMATAGGDWRTNPATQIAWGLSYIAARYGTPCSAWAHSQAVNWY